VQSQLDDRTPKKGTLETMTKLLACTALAAAALGVASTQAAGVEPARVPAPQVVSCRITQNRTTNPDRASATCSGSGRVQFHIRCFYYDDGPFLHRWTPFYNSPVTLNLSCTSTYPLISSAWVSTSYPW
jgi:hypothetical protein